ncbi:hypothetical protein SDC9_67854 [bioreactor metagenome]|uniref:Uncharacterized protein n=1 Tax=bioreactor metagenome TaxID=1076179 RepID=A0A644XYU7_9ZZZZ
MRGNRHCIGPFCTALNIKAFIPVTFFLKAAVNIFGQITVENRRLMVTRLIDGLFHPLVKLVACNANNPAKPQCVRIFKLSGYHHQIKGGFVVNHQFSEAVIDQPTRRIFIHIAQSIVVGRSFIAVIHNLNKEQLDNKYQSCCCKQNVKEEFPAGIAVVFRHV